MNNQGPHDEQGQGNIDSFVEVLLEYLEASEPPLYQVVKAVIEESSISGGPQDIVTTQLRLRTLVSEAHWKKAQAFFNHCLREKKLHQLEQRQENQDDAP